ncbi:cytochrome P460 family protein [Fluviibacterium sp. DFM31]|uniref:Cytochrome P460 family protein n=1 Tax=Meridianimarinicoccus marinus TaxID=3231483 RepID=A0ABV3L0X8_9RHOB
MKTTRVMIGAGLAVLGLAGSALAQDCDPGKSGYDLTGEEAAAVYDCIAGALKAGYDSGPKRWIPAEFVADYRDWTAASAFPAAPGVHSERFLVTYVNDVGAEAYMRYAEDPVIPAGTVIAKESFAVSEAGKVTPGPLFLMQKVEAGTSPETLDWYYMAVAPSGAPMALDVMTACNECHLGYDFQGGLGYPVEEARISN